MHAIGELLENLSGEVLNGRHGEEDFVQLFIAQAPRARVRVLVPEHH